MATNYINRISKQQLTHRQLCVQENASIPRGADFGDWTAIKYQPAPEASEGHQVVLDGVEERDGSFFYGWTEQPLPEVAVPAIMSVSIFQALAQLDIDGEYDAVEAYFAAETTPRIEKLAWAKVQVVERHSNLANSLATMLGWNEARVDQFFAEADLIKI